MKSQIHLKKPDGAYWSDIRQIIKRHYEPKISRYLLGGRRNASEWEYYYNSADFETAYNYALTYNTEYPDDEAGADILAYLDTRVNINTNLVNDVYNVGNGQ